MFSGKTVRSKESSVELRAGDNLAIEEGATVRAATTVRLFGDYGNADPGVGSTIDPRGQITASSVEIYGEADGDVFDLRNLSVPASVSGAGGVDTLMGPNGLNSWEILGPNTGNLNGTFIFFNDVESLTGGSGDDTFYFRGQGSVDGVVDGGAGWDILDFLQSDFIQDAAASFLVTDLPTVGDTPVTFAKTGGIVHIEDILVILLAEVQADGTLVLNMGPRAAERLAINTVDGDEEFILTHVAGDPAAEEGETIGVEAFGIDVIIIGGGPAGLVAWLYSKRAALDTLLLEKGLLGGQIAISKDVENYPGVEGITGFDLAERLERQTRSFGLLIDRQEVVEVIPGNGCHTVRIAHGELLHTTALILATGGAARKLGVPGEAEYPGRGVSYCATCDGNFFRDRAVVVVGGGDTAAEEAAYLGRISRRVYLVRMPYFLGISKSMTVLGL